MVTIRNSSILSSLFGAVLIGLLSSCGGGGSSSGDSTAVSAVIGSAGGSLTSSDGNATLTVPAGALADDTKITMTEVSGNDIPAELQDPSVLKVYDMQPDGLQFAVPATMEVHTLGSPAPPDGAPLIALISDSHGTLEAPGPLTQTVDSSGITSSAPISHFSSLATATDEGVKMSLSVSPTSLPVGNDFVLTFNVKTDKSLNGSATDVSLIPVIHDWDTKIVSLPSAFDPDDITLAPGKAQDITRTVTGTCLNKVGTSDIKVGIDIKKDFFDNYAFQVFVSGGYSNILKVTVDCTALPSVPPTTVGLGLHANPGGHTKSEQAVFLGSVFANLTGGALAAFAGAEGYVISDLTTGEVKRTKTGSAPFLGAVPISQDPPGPDSHAAVFPFGSSPFLDNYDSTAGDFSSFVFTFMNEITDVSNAGGALTADEQLYVDVFGVNFVTFDAAAGSYQPTMETIPASGIGSGTQVSAFEQTAGGPVLVVTRVAAPGTGRLYFAPRDSTAPTDVGAVGPDARRIRCAASVCAVTSFAGDELTIVLWDGANLPTIIGNVTVGDGPVDLDLVALTNGDVLIGSTGFNDNTWTVTEIASDGSVVSNTTQPVDAGCTNPGHISFFEDDDGMKALVTCYGSDNYDVLSL